VLDRADLALARRIARTIRTSNGGLPCLKALGLPLAHTGQVQVSMNLTDYRKTSPVAAFDAVLARAEAAGVRVAGSELVGLIPRAACPEGFAARVRLLSFDPDQVIENRLRRVSGRREG
jgi:glutamate formiminotransferase